MKFSKDILSNKRSLGEFKTMALTEEYSAIIHNKLPSKLKDLGNFTILCIIGVLFFAKALSDLRASFNLMPLFIYIRLGFEKN